MLTLLLIGCGSSSNYGDEFQLHLGLTNTNNEPIDNVNVVFINKTVVDNTDYLILDETRPTTSFNFCTYDRGMVTLTVVDVERNYVTTVADEFIEKGCHSRVWDVTDDNGVGVVSGAYYLLLEFDYESDDELHTDEYNFYLPNLLVPNAVINHGSLRSTDMRPFVNLYELEPYEYYDSDGNHLEAAFSDTTVVLMYDESRDNYQVSYLSIHEGSNNLDLTWDPVPWNK